jgi:hypothetical protein
MVKNLCVKIFMTKNVDLMKFLLYTSDMYLNLTNASPAHRGMKLSIDRDLVVTMHSSMITREDGMIEMVTFVFCPPHGTWEVQETFDEVLSQLNQPEL